MSRRRWLAGVATSFGLLVLVALLGTSAAVAPIGSAPWLPLGLSLNPPSALVTGLLWGAYLIGAYAVWMGWQAGREGMELTRETVRRGAYAVALASVLVAPQGSADHLSYAAYGRLAALGLNPYEVIPQDWMHDPVVGGVQPPWEDTVSVYGPVATGVQAATAWAGAGNLHLTVWWWQVVVAASYLAVVHLALRLVRPGPDTTRVGVGVALNPVLVGTVVFGAHIDVLAMAFALGAAALVGRHPFWAGTAAAAAMAVKLPYGVAGLGALVALLTAHRVVTTGVVDWRARLTGTRAWADVARLGLGALVALVPAHLLAGPHVYDQARVASGFTSLATPWRAVANLASALGEQWRSGALSMVPVLVVVVAWLIWRATRDLPGLSTDPGAATVLRVMLVVGGAWTLAAPYVLPWYDILLWVPLMLLASHRRAAGSPLDRLLLIRTTMLVLAYVPGRVVGMSEWVETITLGVRSVVSPVVLAVLAVLAIRLSLRSAAESSSRS